MKNRQHIALTPFQVQSAITDYVEAHHLIEGMGNPKATTTLDWKHAGDSSAPALEITVVVAEEEEPAYGRRR